MLVFQGKGFKTELKAKVKVLNLCFTIGLQFEISVRIKNWGLKPGVEKRLQMGLQLRLGFLDWDGVSN